MKIIFLIAVLLFFLFALVPRSAPEKTVSGTGPGYIAPFQGYPGSGISGV